MTQSTFSVQVANNLLTLLQGYSKTIRLLLVMFLTLTASAVWGATYTKVTSAPTDWSGEYIVVYESNNTAHVWTGVDVANCNTTANISSNSVTGDFVTVTIAPMTGGYSIKVNGGTNSGKYIYGTSGSNKLNFDANAQLNTLSYETDWVKITSNTSVLTFNKTSSDMRFRYYKSSSYSSQQHIQLYKLSTSGGSTPDPTTYTIKWHTAVGTTTDVPLNEGETITQPATDPTMTGYEFMGWTDQCNVATDGAGFTPLTNFGTADSDKDFYAVFAVATTTGGGGGSTTGSKTLVSSSSSTYYQSGYITGVLGTNSASWTADGFTMVQNKNSSSSAIALNYAEIRVYASHSIVFTPSTGSTITSIVATATSSSYANALGGSSIANCTKSVSGSVVTITPTDGTQAVTIANSAQSRLKTIVVNYTTSGGGSTSYNNYITTCAGAEPEPDPIPVTSVSLDKTSHTMNEGETVTLTATVLPANADDPSVSWESDNEAVAKVNDNGVVTAVSPGNATITVTTTDGEHTATCTIKVNALPTVEGTWTLVTNAANLKAGDRIVIAAAEYDFALSTTQNTNNRGQAAVTKDGNIIKFTEFTQIITLEAGTVDNTLAFNTGAGYLYAASSSSNHLKTQDTKNENGSWSISIENTGVATVVAQGENTNNTLFYNQSSKLFSCYANTATQKAIAIYKEGGSTTTYTITSTLSHVTANGENPTTITSEAEDLTLTYSAESGWNLPATISVTMGGTPLSSETDYDWDNGDLLIAPASGFTGNIVVTINGWQQLAAPTGLDVSKITSSTATLSWSPVANASSYTVQVLGENDEVIVEYTGLTKNTKDVSDLAPETNYVFGVVAVGDGITYTNSIQEVSDVFTTSTAATPTAGYTIIHHREALDGTYPDDLIVRTTGTADVGSTITAEKKTYTGFVCNDAVQTITIQADAAQNVVTYNYVRQSYTLTWDLDGGNIIAEGTPAGTVKYGAPLTAPTVEKAGYRFDHWNPNVPATMQDGDRTYKAFYTQQHTVNWVSQGTVIRTDTYDTGAALKAAPTTGIVACDGKTHVGWTTQGGYADPTNAPADMFEESSGTVTADATYYAVYAEGSGGGGTGWTAVTSTSDLEAGATYAICSAVDGGTYLSTYTGGNNFPGSPTKICPLVLGGTTDAWTFQISEAGTYNNFYLTATNTTGNNYLKAIKDKDDYCYFTISFDDNAAVITCTGKDSRNILRKNTQSNLFACYTSGQSAVYLQKYSGGGYTNYTTSCTTIAGIKIEGQILEFNQFDEFNFGGTVYTIDEDDNPISDVTNLATFDGYNMSQSGEQTVTVTYLGYTIDYTITVNKLPVWNITWSVGGKTNTGIGPREVVRGKTIGECSSTGDLQTPSVDCEGKVFMGWTESNTVPTDGVGIAYIDKNTKPDSDKTYYAVFATKEVGDGVALTQCNGSTEFNAGDNIVIVASGQDWSYLCYQETSGTTYIVNHEFVNNATTLINDDKNYWTLETANGGFYLGDNTNGYMYLPNSNDLCVSTDNKSIWKIEWNAETSAFNIKSDRWLSCRSDLSEGNKYKWRGGGTDGGNGTTNLQIYKITGNTTYTDYSTSCGTFTITYYGFGGCTTTCGDNPGEISVPQFDTYTIPTCTPTEDPQGLNRTFAGTWVDDKGNSYKPGDSFEVTDDITLYAQWKLETTKDVELPTNVVDLATTDIVVTGGTTLTLQAGTTTLNSLTLEGGRTNDGYLMPAIYSDDEASVELTETTIPFYLSVDMANYYPFAVPFSVEVSNVNYADPTLANASVYGTHYVIKRYDGANRANQGENKDANWVVVSENETLKPGVGYIITAVPIGGEALIRFPMTITTPLKQTEQSVTVTAHTGTATDINKGGHQRHAGWNFIANPYLSRFAGVNVGNEKNLLNGVLNYVNGEWQKIGEVPYVTIPASDFSYYEQVELDNAILSPSYAFFVQAAQTAPLSFATVGRQQYMPALRAAAVEPLRLPLMLTQTTANDRTTLLVSDDYTANYEIGKDLEKMFGSAEQVSLYAWSSNTPLAYCAVPWASAIQAIPLGYRARQAGSVTIALDASADMSDAEMVLLYDAVTGMTTNLLLTDYVFESETGTFDARFTITITPKQGATTGCEEVMLPTDGTYKFLRNGQLYINHRGTVYTVEGRENSRVRQ